MADEQKSKAAKKNAKRKAAKKTKAGGDYGATAAVTASENEFTPERLLPMLKEELEKAKSEKDRKRISKLREQIWVLNDMVNGFKTDIPEEDLKPILESLPLYQNKEKPKPAPVVTSVVVSDDRRVRNINKKLDQITALKERQANGEVLEKNQLDKISTEAALREELQEIQELLQNAFSRS